jgi:hypothetical protein
MPRSSTARFTEKWQKSVGDEGFLDSIVDRWRNSSSASAADAAHNMTMFAEAMNLTSGPSPDAPADPAAVDDRAAPAREPITEPLRRDFASLRREQPAAPAAAGAPVPQPASALRTIRDRLQQR